MCIIIFFMLIFIVFSLLKSYFKFFSLGFLVTQYPINRLCEGHVFAMSGNHLPVHDHIPFVGNYPSIPINRNTVNPAIPITIQSYILYIEIKFLTLYKMELKIKEFDVNYITAVGGKSVNGLKFANVRYKNSNKFP